MRFRHSGFCAVLALGLAFPGNPLAAQTRSSSAKGLREWSASSERWLEGQVTPNRVVPDPDPTRRRLLVSYDVSPKDSPRGYNRSATYDNALAALVFLAAGQRDRAAFTLHALARLVRADGSLWAGYNTANNWPEEGDHGSAVVRAGAVGWVGYALTFYLARQPACAGDRGCEQERAFFLETAQRLATYLLSLQVNAPGDRRDGLLRLGSGSVRLAYRADVNNVVEVYKDEPALGISTENNISCWFFLRQLAALTGDAGAKQAAERIQGALLRAGWNDGLGEFNQGFDADGIADRSRALDCASWGALFLLAAGDTARATRALGTIDENFSARSGPATGYRPYSEDRVYGDPDVARFFYPDNPDKRWRDLPLVWSEGTLGVALAWLRLGQAERARKLAVGLSALQVQNSGLRYASLSVPFQMGDAPSVAASSWLFFVAEALAGNPVANQIWH